MAWDILPMLGHGGVILQHRWNESWPDIAGNILDQAIYHNLEKMMPEFWFFYHYNALMNLSSAWDDCLCIIVPNVNPMLMRQLMKNRCEVKSMMSTIYVIATHTIVLTFE